jgi:acid phosphatase type 7
MRISLPVVLLLGLIVAGPTRAEPTFSVPDAAVPDPLVLVAYGDTRFTQPGETEASSPKARRALVAKVAAENPAAIFINGDLPYHGIAADYEVYRSETQVWRDQHLRVYPALGNHEFSACLQSSCLDRWWSAFPELRGRRWYSVAVGGTVLGVALDSDASLLPGSDQRIWLQGQLTSLAETVRLVLIVMHHPPVADLQTSKLVDHNARPNEQALAAYLQTMAAHSKARFIVSAGHIHNYERLAQDGVTYLVSGGGGATPYDIDRTPEDLYRGTEFPNYHYVRFELHGQHVRGEMIRLEDSAGASPSHWRVKDKFEIILQP